LRCSQRSFHSQPSGAFTAEDEAFWAAARRAHGDAEGTRELVEVLLLHRHLTHQDVVDGLAAATSIGAARADVVAVEARRIAEHRPAQDISSHDVGGSIPQPVRQVISLTQRRLGDPAAVIAGLPADTRPLPTVAAYDELSTRRTAQQSTPAEGSEVS
jgi:hypothetical protein